MKHLRTSLLLMVSISSVFIFTADIQSQDTSITNFYPLALGNSWTYYYYCSPAPGCQPYRLKETVTGIKDTNGHRYFILLTVRIGYSNEYSYLRIDSLTCSIRYLLNYFACTWLTGETAGDSLAARYRDSSKYACLNYYRFIDSLPGIYFNMLKQKKGFVWTNYHELGGTRTLVKNIGIVYSQQTGPTWISYRLLTGCKIDGIVYGDTSLTGINNISSEIPESYSLSQNYPNPFNPTTKIKFSIPSPSPLERAGLRLVIYDALGREVQTLVNESLQPGTYEVDFDGSNFSSGIYYYTLNSIYYNETKKMVLIK